MFELVDRPVLWIPVEWEGLVAGPNPDDLAVETKFRVELLVELVDKDDIKALFLSPETAPGEEEIFARVVRNWRKIGNKGTAVPFNAENSKLLLSKPGFSLAFTHAYLSASSGKLETREKNSDSSPANGWADEPESETNATTISTGSAAGSE